MSWSKLDSQLARWCYRLVSQLKIPPSAASKLATTVAAEVRFLPAEAKLELRNSSPVALKERLEELVGFQGFMDATRSVRNSPYLVRAQVITQNYICFLYLPESCFRILRRALPVDSTTRGCAKFLSDNPIRAFRNALAHANWCYGLSSGSERGVTRMNRLKNSKCLRTNSPSGNL
jgi:hypothetical protein